MAWYDREITEEEYNRISAQMDKEYKEKRADLNAEKTALQVT